MADSTYNDLPEARGRWLALAGLFAAAAGVFTFFVTKARRTTQPPLLAATTELSLPMPQASTQSLPDSLQSTALKPAPSLWRTLAFLVFTLILVMMLIVLQNNGTSLSVPLFLGLVIGAILLAIASTPQPVRTLIRAPTIAIQTLYREIAQWLQPFTAIFLRYRFIIATLSTLLAVIYMIQSALAFQLVREEKQPVNKALTLMVYGIVAVAVALFCARPNIALPTFANVRAAADVYHPNRWLTGVGIAVLLLLAEINGRMLDVSRLYPITMDTQFWILILGISMVVMGLSGWNPVLRLPPIKWRILFLGITLVVVSLLVGEILNLLPFTLWFISTALNTIFFWTLRLGHLLILWAIFFGGLKLQRPSLNPITFLVIIALLLYMALLSIVGIRTNLPEWFAGVSSNPLFWLAGAGLSIFIWRMGWLKAVNWRLALAGLVILIALYVVAIISGTLVIDIAFWLVINPHFWMFMAVVNLLRVPLTAFYQSIASKPSDGRDELVTSIAEGAENLPLSESKSLASNTGHYALLIAIILIAFFVRFYLLNDTMRFFIDEDLIFDATYYLRINPTTGLLSPFSGIAPFPYIFPYFEAKTIDLFGPNFMGLRGASAIIGALTIPALYLLARFLFDRQTALVAALFLATFPPHIHFSRIGINEMTGPLCATLAFAFVGRGLLHNRPWHYAVGGIFLGLTHYFDEGSRLLFAPVMLAWIVGLLIVWRQKVHGKHLMVAVIATVLVVLPIYYTLIGLDRPLAGRMVDNQSGLSGAYWRNLFESGDFKPHIDAHIIAAFMVYPSYLDQSLFYAGKTAMLLWYMIPIVLLGIAYALWRWRSPGMALILIWIISVSLGNSLLTSSMAYPRFVLVFPALMLAAAVGLRYSIPLVIRSSRLAGYITLALTLGLCAGQFLYYFNDHLPLYNTQFRGQKATPDGYDAALRSVNFPEGTTIHIISLAPVSQIEASGLLHLSRPDLYLDSMTRDRFTYDYIDAIRCRVDHAFFIERTDFQTLDKLREKFYLREPQFTPYDDLLPGQRLILFYAPYIRGSEDIYGRKC